MPTIFAKELRSLVLRKTKFYRYGPKDIASLSLLLKNLLRKIRSFRTSNLGKHVSVSWSKNKMNSHTLEHMWYSWQGCDLAQIWVLISTQPGLLDNNHNWITTSSLQVAFMKIKWYNICHHQHLGRMWVHRAKSTFCWNSQISTTKTKALLIFV